MTETLYKCIYHSKYKLHYTMSCIIVEVKVIIQGKKWYANWSDIVLHLQMRTWGFISRSSKQQKVEEVVFKISETLISVL